MNKNVQMSLWMDFYGDFLTPKQSELMEMYYTQDFSLAEIAQHSGISRQAAHDAIHRGEAMLTDMERRLGLARHYLRSREWIGKGRALAGQIERDALRAGLEEVFQHLEGIWEDENGL